MSRPDQPVPALSPILVDPAPLLALRAMLDRILGTATELGGAAPAALLTLDPARWGGSNPWVAEMVIMASGSIERSFLRARADYTHADKKGRGTKLCYVLRPGIVYEVHKTDGKREDRYLCRVVAGEIQRLSGEEAQRWADGLLFADARSR